MYYSNSNNDLDVAVSTNITLVRNLANYPFPNKMDEVQIDAASEEIINGLFSDSGLSFDNFAIISQDSANNKGTRKLILSNDKTVSINLCFNNHIEVGTSFEGFNLGSANKAISAIDNIICGEFLMAFDSTLGFLTENLNDLGTGMKASVTLFLPALEMAGNISEIIESVSKIGLTLNKTNDDDIAVYSLTNTITMGITCDEAVRNLESICSGIIDKERYYRMQMFGDSIDGEYQAVKTYILNSSEITHKKALNLLYRLRLCSAMGVGKNSLQKVSHYITETTSNKEATREYLSEYLKSKLA